MDFAVFCMRCFTGQFEKTDRVVPVRNDSHLHAPMKEVNISQLSHLHSYTDQIFNKKLLKKHKKTSLFTWKYHQNFVPFKMQESLFVL